MRKGVSGEGFRTSRAACSAWAAVRLPVKRPAWITAPSTASLCCARRRMPVCPYCGQTRSGSVP
jgi:hypothetical protein